MSPRDYCTQSKIKYFNFLSKKYSERPEQPLKKTQQSFLMEIPDFRTKLHTFLSAERVQFQSKWRSSTSECMELRMPKISFMVNINNDKFSKSVVRWPFIANLSNDLPYSQHSFLSVCLWRTSVLENIVRKQCNHCRYPNYMQIYLSKNSWWRPLS